MKYLLIMVVMMLFLGCTKSPKMVQLESSKIVPLSGNAVLFKHAEAIGNEDNSR